MSLHGRKTVVGYDGSPSAQAALEWAAADAGARSGELLILRVAEPGGQNSGPDRGRGGGQGWQGLQDGIRRARLVAVDLPVTAEHSQSGPVGCLVEASRRAELLVVGIGGGPGAGPDPRVVSLAERAHCPVVVVRTGFAQTPAAGPVLPVAVGFDGSPGAGRALDFAAERAARRGAELIVVTPEAGEGCTAVEKVTAVEVVALASRSYPSLRVRAEEAEALSELADRCSLVVVGPRQLLGPTRGPLAIVS